MSRFGHAFGVRFITRCLLACCVGSLASAAAGFSASPEPPLKIPAPSPAKPEPPLPFEQRPFARKAGPAPSAWRTPVAPPPLPGTWLADTETGRSNELILVLGDTPPTDRELLPELPPDASAPQFERAVVAGVLAQHKPLLQALGQPLHARFVVGDDRMSDEARARSTEPHLPGVRARHRLQPA